MKAIFLSMILEDILTDDPLGWLLAYTSGLCGVGTFRELRMALASRA